MTKCLFKQIISIASDMISRMGCIELHKYIKPRGQPLLSNYSAACYYVIM